MITQRLVSSFENIIYVKLYFFLRRSIWKYLILTFIMGFSLPIKEFSPVTSSIIYFVCVMVLLLPLQYFSAKKISKEINFDALVEFNTHEIKIHHTNKDKVEIHDWNWVHTIDLKKERIWLTINEVRPFAISIPKSKLSASEIEFFKRQKKIKIGF